MNSRVHECEYGVGVANHKLLRLLCGHTYACQNYDQIERYDCITCPTCKKITTTSLKHLPVASDLIHSDENAELNPAHSERIYRCTSHDSELLYLCIDCENLTCWKGSREVHLNHRVEPMADIAVKDSEAGPREKIRKKVQAQHETYATQLSILQQMINVTEEMAKCKVDFEKCKDLVQASQSSTEKSLADLDSLLSHSSKERIEKLTSTIYQWKTSKIPHEQKLTETTAKLDKLWMKYSELKNSCGKRSSSLLENTGLRLVIPRQRLVASPSGSTIAIANSRPAPQRKPRKRLRIESEKFVRETSPETSCLLASFGPAEDSELLTDDTRWMVSSNDDVRRALASVRSGRRPSPLEVESSALEPIRMLPEVLKVLGAACLGFFTTKDINSFWNFSTENSHDFFKMLGFKVEKFRDSYKESVTVVRARRELVVMLCIGIYKTDDIEHLPSFDYVLTSFSFNKNFSARDHNIICTKMMRFKSHNLHFPDLQSGDQVWVNKFFDYVDRRFFKHLYLPRCHLPEDDLRALLMYFTEEAPIIHCEHTSLSDNARERLNTLTQKRNILLHWKIDTVNL